MEILPPKTALVDGHFQELSPIVTPPPPKKKTKTKQKQNKTKKEKKKEQKRKTTTQQQQKMQTALLKLTYIKGNIDCS